MSYDFQRPFLDKSNFAIYLAQDKETSRNYGREVKGYPLSNREYQHRYNKLHNKHRMKSPPSNGRIFSGYLVVRNLNTNSEYETWIPDQGKNMITN